jgi:hypothetical protein
MLADMCSIAGLAWNVVKTIEAVGSLETQSRRYMHVRSSQSLLHCGGVAWRAAPDDGSLAKLRNK